MTDQKQEKRLRDILDTSFDAFVGIGKDGLIIEWNKQAEKMFGWTYPEAIGQSMAEMIIPENLIGGHRRGMAHFLDSEQANLVNKRLELQAKRKSGELFPMEMAVTYLANGDGYEFYAFVQDISARKAEEERLRYLVTNDCLTGLKNRLHFNNSLPEAMSRCRRKEASMALMYLDIDHFKSINDSLGHEAGDDLLKEFAKKLKSKLREVDVVFRLGGDEFTIIVEGVIAEYSAVKVATNIIQELGKSIWLGNPELKVTTSIGIAIYDGRAIEPDKLVALADKAMYTAKHSGRNNFKILKFEDEAKAVIPALSKKTQTNDLNTEKMFNIPSPMDPDFFQTTLSSLRRHLDMDFGFISEFKDGYRVFKFVDSKDLNPPIAVGDSHPLENSYCQRVVDGRLPEIINDAFELPETIDLRESLKLPVRAHMGVPIRLASGKIYGTFCFFSYKTNQTLNERDISVMHVFSDVIARQLKDK